MLQPSQTKRKGHDMAKRRTPVDIEPETHADLVKYTELRGFKIKAIADRAVREFLTRNKKEAK